MDHGFSPGVAHHLVGVGRGGEGDGLGDPGPDFLDIDENGIIEPELPLDFDLFGQVFDQVFGLPGFEAEMGCYEVSGLISR